MSGELALVASWQQELKGVIYQEMLVQCTKNGPSRGSRIASRSRRIRRRHLSGGAYAAPVQVCTMGKEKQKRPGQVPPDSVDCPTQLICGFSFVV